MRQTIVIVTLQWEKLRGQTLTFGELVDIVVRLGDLRATLKYFTGPEVIQDQLELYGEKKGPPFFNGSR